MRRKVRIYGFTRLNILEFCWTNRPNLFNTILCFHFLTMVLEQYVFMSLLQNTRALISKKQPPKSILLKGVEAKIIACGKH